MRNLFELCCSGDIFRHDAIMMKAYEMRLEQENNGNESHIREESDRETQCSSTSNGSPVAVKHPKLDDDDWGAEARLVGQGSNSGGYFTPAETADPRQEILPNVRDLTTSVVASECEQHLIGPSQEVPENEQNITSISATVPPSAYNPTASNGYRKGL